MSEPLYDYGDMTSGERITDYQERCPNCKELQRYSDSEKYCEWCGYDYGRDWETVEVDLDTHVILRTVIPAQPPAAQAGESQSPTAGAAP